MSSVTDLAPSLATRRAMPRTFGGLARHELRRYVLNPVFLLGAGLTFVLTMAAETDTITSIAEAAPYVAIVLGGFSMMAAFWQTRSLRPSSAVVDATPVSLPLRTAALCVPAIVPLVCGVANLLLFRHNAVVAGDWVWGAFDPSTRTATLVSQLVLPSLGGPLLGVALGRWIRFPGAGFLLLVFLYAWVIVVTLPSVFGPTDSAWAVGLRFFAPFAFFVVTDNGTGVTTTWRGSPWLFIGWQLALCALAVVAALLRGAEGTGRRHILRVLWAVLVAAAVLLVLAVQGGLAHAVAVTPP